MKTKLILTLMILTTLPLFAESAYISSLRGTLYSNPSLGSKKITTVKRGTEIQISKKEGAWLYVSHNSLKGWIPKSNTVKTMPKGKVSILGNASRTSRMKARERASSDVTAASARGFMQSETVAGRNRPNSESLKFDPRDIEKMENLVIPEEELLSFLEAGGLGR
ncbi:MAG: SH3 domain-containing protein [Spirochaetes bacterium]|jgi:uncharacterized protein YraI|nr:SH3 domain-containing protein [Spirochaetota bacterium]